MIEELEIPNNEVVEKLSKKYLEKLCKRFLHFMQLHLSSLSCRRLPYIVVGVEPGVVLFTNVSPELYGGYIRHNPSHSYTFVHLNGNALFLEKFLKTKIDPDIGIKNPVFAIDASQLLKELKLICSDIEANDCMVSANNRFHKVDTRWYVKSRMDEYEKYLESKRSKEEDEESEEIAEDENLDADNPPTKLKKIDKPTPIVWLLTRSQIDHHLLIYETLSSVNKMGPVKFKVDPNTISKSDVSFVQVADKPFESLEPLKFNVKYPIVDGLNCVSITEYHKKFAKGGLFKEGLDKDFEPAPLLEIRTWLYHDIMRCMVVYKFDCIEAWTYTPAYVWFPNQMKKVIQMPTVDSLKK